jgi:hypothetical protein
MISKKVSERGKDRKNEKVREGKFTSFSFKYSFEQNFKTI